jgi:hypothetical protein
VKAIAWLLDVHELAHGAEPATEQVSARAGDNPTRSLRSSTPLQDPGRVQERLRSRGTNRVADARSSGKREAQAPAPTAVIDRPGESLGVRARLSAFTNIAPRASRPIRPAAD